jgi:hypothetical protein
MSDGLGVKDLSGYYSVVQSFGEGGCLFQIGSRNIDGNDIQRGWREEGE